MRAEASHTRSHKLPVLARNRRLLSTSNLQLGCADRDEALVTSPDDAPLYSAQDREQLQLLASCPSAPDIGVLYIRVHQGEDLPQKDRDGVCIFACSIAGVLINKDPTFC